MFYSFIYLCHKFLGLSEFHLLQIESSCNQTLQIWMKNLLEVLRTCEISDLLSSTNSHIIDMYSLQVPAPDI